MGRQAFLLVPEKKMQFVNLETKLTEMICDWE